MGWNWRLLRAGAFKLDGGAMFGIIPRPLWTRVCESDDRNRIQLETNCLLLERDGRTVLIETGIGDKMGDKLREIYALESRSIIDALAEEKIDPASIDTVIVTHLHFDHAGGLTRKSDSGAAPTFPNAEIVTQRQEWEDALANKSTMHSTYLRDHLDPIASRVRQIDGAGAVLPDIWVEPLPGHTWGQQGVFFKDADGATVVFPGDLMPTRHHAGLTFGMAYDVLPYESMLQKGRFLERAAAEGWTIVLDHDPGDPVVRAVPHPEKAGAHVLKPVAAD
ncbi:MAG: MBL fold metallo-hydrolase [Planctomycetota bacterium]|nr:MBL fold metallo-hydrolase [Planctomycetota bacterium]